MISLKRKQTGMALSQSKGFTIVELLIVIVVIGILAAIVITTFVGVQKRARDSERKSDLQAMASQIEVYFADNGKYPTLDNMNNVSPTDFRTKNLKGLKAEALADPSNAATQTLTATVPGASSTVRQYSYVVLPSLCDNTAGNECTSFTLEANLENDASPAVNHIITGANN
ncbi:prepilin-type N-terminal cleavage/methylation domain-containing protein [Candidatus Parcubacteria bacterium]|nr:prepilin-type N-terminal cleavage/methylation domain-containing protein [Candidatus Parcubacteria bacterium]